MRVTITLLCFIFSIMTQAQDSKDDAVKMTIDRFFEGFHKRDTTLMRSVLGEDVQLQSIGASPSGDPVLRSETMKAFLQSMASLPDTLVIEERLLDYQIQADGAMAHAWTPYEFYVHGEFRHCGVNSFQLFHDGNAWKIIYLADTRRRENCNQ